MRVLLVTGGINSIWVRTFVEKVLYPLGCDIYIQKNPREKNLYEDFYKNYKVNFVYEYKSNKSIRSLPKIGFYYNFIKRYNALKKDIEYDYIIVMYGNSLYLKIAKKMASENTKNLVWYIGSDILRAGKNECRLISKLLSEIDAQVICINKKLENELRKKTGYSRNIELCDFGNSRIKKIDDALDDNIDYKNKLFKIAPSTISIAVGYSASPYQQHIKIIEAINRIYTLDREKIFLILPMTYNGTQKYIENIRKYLYDYNFNFIILTDFLNEEEMAHLWASVDIFIHAQTTDAFSSSLLESVYAGCQVYNASWNKYPELEEWNIPINEFNDFDELTDLLEKKISQNVVKKRENIEKIKEYFSWESCCDKWKTYLEIE